MHSKKNVEDKNSSFKENATNAINSIIVQRTSG